MGSLRKAGQASLLLMSLRKAGQASLLLSFGTMTLERMRAWVMWSLTLDLCTVERKYNSSGILSMMQREAQYRFPWSSAQAVTTTDQPQRRKSNLGPHPSLWVSLPQSLLLMSLGGELRLLAML